VNVARVMQKKTRSSGWTCWGSSASPWPCRGRARGNPAVPRVQLLAAGYVLGAVILWAVGTVLGRYALSGISFTTTSAMRFILALPFLLGLMLHDLGPAGFSGYALGQVPNFLVIAVIPG
jgi:drug/metabolite transporter (DMT)-like permease